MLEIIALIFLTGKIGVKAEQKGLKPGAWKAYTVVAWILAEIIGVIIGSVLFGRNLLPLLLFAVFCAFGGYLFIHALLSKKPDVINKGPDDLL